MAENIIAMGGNIVTESNITPDQTQKPPNAETTLVTESVVIDDEVDTNVVSNMKTTKDTRRGSLYKYLDKKTLKSGKEVSYPRVAGERDPNNIKHWKWGFCWEEKVNGEWRNRSIGCPTSIVSIVTTMQNQNFHLSEIISFIKHSKQNIIQNYKFGLIVNES